MADLKQIASKAASILGPVLQSALRPPDSPYDPQADPYKVPWRFEDIARQAFQAAKYKAGEYIASTPEGQAAIKEHLRQQALTKAGAFGRYAVPLVLGLGLLLIARRTGRRRR